VFNAHLEWGRKFADPLMPASTKFSNPSAEGRKLRIGYVSPDFKRHSVSYFFEPLLERHDRSRFEVTLYANLHRPDEVTARLQEKCDRWRDIITLSDHEAAEQIRADQIDVLVDLAGRTLGNRMLLFARKPAPVQVTYLGYPETTGLRAIDWRITDELADPPGTTEQFHTEKLWRVPAPFVRYRPPEQSPAVASAPAAANGYITFGSFNKAAKAGDETIALWSKVLRASPTSRLIVKALGLRTVGSRQRLLDGFAAQRIDRARIALIEGAQSLQEHLAMYGRVDVALDTFPYHGTTTTCEALWMGVPVVSLAGPVHVSRVGVSLLTAVGHPDWATTSAEAFVAKTLELAPFEDAQRQHLRQEMVASPLCDAAGLAISLELAYQQMFSEFQKTGPFSR
jgi:predicted O-linked N-acetylglucosamine transferase (SPINDLY family)